MHYSGSMMVNLFQRLPTAWRSVVRRSITGSTGSKRARSSSSRLASLMGQRTGPVILIIVVQIILTPILALAAIPHLQDLQRSFVGVAMAHLEPSGLPAVFGLPGVTGGVTRPGAAQSALPESATQAACVIIAWLVGWTILGAWRMMTRDA